MTDTNTTSTMWFILGTLSEADRLWISRHCDQVEYFSRFGTASISVSTERQLSMLRLKFDNRLLTNPFPEFDLSYNMSNVIDTCDYSEDAWDSLFAVNWRHSSSDDAL